MSPPASPKTAPPDQAASPKFKHSSDLNREEQNVAVCLDREQAIKWWHRNVARTHYGLQGWKRGRIYPDFIFAVKDAALGERTIILETKGDHLQNPDTDYKRDVLDYLTKNFSWDRAAEAGQLQLEAGNRTVE